MEFLFKNRNIAKQEIFICEIISFSHLIFCDPTANRGTIHVVNDYRAVIGTESASASSDDVASYCQNASIGFQRSGSPLWRD